MTSNGKTTQDNAISVRLKTLLTGWIDKSEEEIDVEAVDEILRGTTVDPPGLLNKIGSEAASAIETHPQEAVNICMRLTGSRLAETRCLSAVMISQLAKFSPSLWTGMIRHLALDDDWHVRDYAASVFDTANELEGLFAFHPDFVWETLTEWVKDRDYLVRRLTTRAILGCSRKQPEIIPRLLTMWEPLLTDSSEFVRRNLVSALRMLGRKHPESVLSWLNEKLSAPSGHIASIASMTIDASFAHQQPTLRQEIVNKLSKTSSSS